MFFADAGGAVVVAACMLMGFLGAMAATGVLSKTALRHEQSTFIMELPPFRRPRLGQIIVRSLLDRTLFVAGRAVCVAAPAGALLWVLGNTSFMGWFSGALEPFGLVMGMNGVILLAFILSLPANELLMPIMLMMLTGGSVLSDGELSGEILMAAGWTWRTALCTMTFSVFHWPCATTLMTIHKETGSYTKTAAAFILPTAVGCALCMMLNLLL
jgi:ferrous iron transport protein B